MPKGAKLPFPIIVDGDMSDDFVSDPTDCRFQDNIGYQISWSGSSPVGEIFIESTMDDVNSPLVSPTWTPLVFSSQILVNVDDNDGNININQLPFAWIRLRYESTSGDGLMQVKIATKQMGG